jgi:hypothetical protein
MLFNKINLRIFVHIIKGQTIYWKIGCAKGEQYGDGTIWQKCVRNLIKMYETSDSIFSRRISVSPHSSSRLSEYSNLHRESTCLLQSTASTLASDGPLRVNFANGRAGDVLFNPRATNGEVGNRPAA